MQASQTVIALEGKLAPSGTQSFRVDYRVTNTGNESVFILDQILNRSDGRMGPDPSRAYTLLGATGELVLFKGMLPIPDGLQVESPEIPYAQLLDAGKSATGSFEMSKIIPYDNPYDYEGAAEAIEIKSVTLQVGFVPSRLAAGMGEEIERQGRTYYRFRYGALAGRQSVASVSLGEAALQVVRRR